MISFIGFLWFPFSVGATFDRCRYMSTTTRYGTNPFTACGLDSGALVEGTKYLAVASAQAMQDVVLRIWALIFWKLLRSLLDFFIELFPFAKQTYAFDAGTFVFSSSCFKDILRRMAAAAAIAGVGVAKRPLGKTNGKQSHI